MRLVYNLLWVENENGWLKPNLDFVKEIVEENGFELNCTLRSSEAEIDDMLQHEEPFKNFDLILVDFQLDRGDRGNRIIENIREHKIFTEVLFYSQDPQAIRQAIQDHWLDGIFCTDRKTSDFQYKFEKVFKTTIKKIQQISTMRGLVLSETSNLDNIIEDILTDFLDNRSEEEKQLLKKYIIHDCIVASYKSNENKVKALNVEMSGQELINSKLFDAYKKMRTTGHILEMLGNSTLVSKHDFISEYNTEVIEMRNDLAHAREDEVEGKRVLRTRKGNKEFDEANCISIRNNLKKHYNYLNLIKAALTA